MIKIKKILNGIYSVLESMGRARAAAELARNGRTEEANRLINGN
jgi:hypothetical protein